MRFTTLVGGMCPARCRIRLAKVFFFVPVVNAQLTAFSRISAGDDGGGVLNSKGKSAAFRQFLIRGAS